MLNIDKKNRQVGFFKLSHVRDCDRHHQKFEKKKKKETRKKRQCDHDFKFDI